MCFYNKKNNAEYSNKKLYILIQRFKTIHETLLKHPQGTNILKVINGIFTEEDRRNLVRILTSKLVKVHGDN